MKKMPPKEKIHEAISALADGRIEIDGTSAYITSSDYSKKYTVVWNADQSSFTSNDSATYWQGYPGYPVLAALMQMKVLLIPKDLIGHFKNINWNELNTKHKRNYAAAADEALSALTNTDKQMVDAAIDELYDKLSKMDFEVKRGKEPVIKLKDNREDGNA